jgi:hypothetical protein
MNSEPSEYRAGEAAAQLWLSGRQFWVLWLLFRFLLQVRSCFVFHTHEYVSCFCIELHTFWLQFKTSELKHESTCIYAVGHHNFMTWASRSVTEKLTVPTFHSFINGSSAVAGTWPFLQFLNLSYTDGRTPWMSDQHVARPLPTHSRTTPTQNKHIHRHPCL